jgi:hypothetical protein
LGPQIYWIVGSGHWYIEPLAITLDQGQAVGFHFGQVWASGYKANICTRLHEFDCQIATYCARTKDADFHIEFLCL